MAIDYDAELRRIGRVLIDVAHTLEALDDSRDRIDRALVLTGQLVPYSACALLQALPGHAPELLTVPVLPQEERRRLHRRLTSILQLVDDDVTGEVVPEDRVHLTVPIMGLERIIGILRVEPVTSMVYDARHVRLLSVVAAQLGAFLTMVSLRESELQRTQELSAAHDFQRTLVGVASHDLRNPLAVITTIAASLLPKAQDHRQARALERALKNAQRANRIINDLLDVTHARVSGGLQVSPQPCDLVALIQEAVDDARSAHPERELNVVSEAGDTLDGLWDPDRMSQLAMNLINNAFQHGELGRPVEVRIVRHGDTVALSVHNEGTAIPDHLRSTIFDPFRQGNRAHRAAGGGLGLGLYIVQQIARAHGGSVDVRSSALDGTTFTVTVPLAARLAPGPAVAEPPTVSPDDARLRPLILVVDDDHDIRSAMSDFLERRGFRVVTVGNGAEALALLHDGLRPALMLVDLMMPVMDGEELCERCAATPAFATIPRLIVSAHAAAAVKATRFAATPVVEKPVSGERLLRAIEDATRGLRQSPDER